MYSTMERRNGVLNVFGGSNTEVGIQDASVVITDAE